jgi:hypothetical protein
MVDGDCVVPVDVGAHVEPVALAESGPGEGAERKLNNQKKQLLILISIIVIIKRIFNLFSYIVFKE